MNNSSESSIEFVVSSSASLALSHVLNYPNPFTTYTEFWFEHNHPCCVLDVQVQIFTITGRLVKTINQEVQTNGFRAEPISWDGTDDYGSPLAKGVYIYRIRIKSEEGGYAEKSEKLVILK
jgi:flagellar hook assembly protein FlgD